VHGSINRFTCDPANKQIECDLWSEATPPGVKRVVAAPGDQKYEGVAVNIMDTAAKARRAEDEAVAFAVIGYGFNDHHLHDPIVGRVRSHDCPLLVLTLDLPQERVKELRASGKKVWILIAQKGSANGTDGCQTLVYSPCNDAPTVLNDERLWSCDRFAEQILGG